MKNKYKYNKIIIMILYLFTYEASGSGLDNLIKYTSPEGTMSNVNQPRIIDEQASGFISGGSIIVRSPKAKSLEPINIQLPSFKYDPCTGSGDFRFGSISYIKGPEFANFFKGLVRASGSYATKLFLKTVCPQCEDIMSQFEAIVRDVNNFSMNHCSMAEGLIDGIAVKLRTSNKQKCLTRSNIGGQSADLWDATRNCEERPDSNDNLGTDETKNLLPDEYNIVWKALTKNGSINDQQFLELLMSISGTLISKKENDRISLRYKPTLFLDDKQIANYIGSGGDNSDMKLYVCDDTSRCLNPTIKTVNINAGKSLYRAISDMLESISDKISKDTGALTSEEENLIGFSSIPIITMIEQNLYIKGVNKTENYEFIDFICYDLVISFLNALLTDVDMEVKNLEMAQLDREIFQNFKISVDQVRQGLQDKRMSSFQRANIVIQVKENMKLQNSEFRDKFSQIFSTLKN